MIIIIKKDNFMSKVKVDENLCIGCGTCEALCPKVFKLDMDSGKSKVISDNCEECDCQEVVNSCPVNAISIEEGK